MAIFEKKIARKVLLDDTEALTCEIVNYHNVNNHTVGYRLLQAKRAKRGKRDERDKRELNPSLFAARRLQEYIVRVQRGPTEDNSWRISRRYNDFLAWHSALQPSGLCLPLPPKKIIGKMDRDFIRERQQGLQNYLNFVLMNPILASSLATKKFIDPDNYCIPFRETALHQISTAFRGEVGWEVVGPVADIGWRLRKHYFDVRRKNSPRDELIASFVDFGPDKYLEEKDLHALFKSFSQLQHPYVCPLELCVPTESGGVFVRKFSKNGSLRDTLCGAKPKHPFLKKYGNPKGHRSLNCDEVALYGRQILEVLKFLHDKGLYFGHLHPGNIMIENDRVQVVDLENGVLGVPSFYRPYFVQHKKICTVSAIDVYSFGHTLYEMAFGSPLHESVCESLPDGCPPVLKSILESILSNVAMKGDLPTVDSLLSNPFFARVSLGQEEKKHLKIPCSVKEQLKMSLGMKESRLVDEQKRVRREKRLARLQEMLSSDEEKKRKQKQKLESRQASTNGEKHSSKSSVPNGTAPERPDSVDSTSTATPSSVSDCKIPSPPPPPPPPALQNSSLGNGGSAKDDNRSALLSSICSFNRASLKKTGV